MKERPILFSGSMVRAILASTKSQTRRIVKPQPSARWRPHSWGDIHRMRDGEFIFKRNGDLVVAGYGPSNEDGSEAHACRYGMPGDRLWVRETWGYTRQCDDINGPGDVVAYAAGHPWHVHQGSGAARTLQRTAAGGLMEPNHWCDQPAKWTPSIHMPRWASRLTLEITDVRVQRLQDISEEDALAEGLTRITKDDGRTWKHGIPDRDGLPGTDNDGWAWIDWEVDPRRAYRRLWESINGAGSWEASPWVWAISFRRITP